jgi:UDP-GlcNAc:undecaprenyl-phosphate/decaprenyl-phosphate GlcNAc-1-phosphate transferase
MHYLILSSVLAFIITLLCIPVIIDVAKKKHLFDEPDERKLHKEIIPALGGIGIFAGFIVSMLLCIPEFSKDLDYVKYFAAAAIIIFFVGLKDDIVETPAGKKFLGQVAAAAIVMHFGNIHISNMYGFFGVTEISTLTSVFLTLFAFVVITNAFNLIDGVDGLAASLGIVTTLAFSIYFYIAAEMVYAVMATATCGALLAFLIYNYAPAKIFMGDTGSLLLGLVNSILVIKFITVAGTSGSDFSMPAAPAIGFAILIVPLFDTLRVFSVRIINRKSPFSADRIHIHHYLLDLGFTHRGIVLTLVSTTLAFIGVAYLGKDLNTTLAFTIIISLALVLKSIVYFFRQRSKKAAKNMEHINTTTTTKKIYSILQEPAESN